MVLSDFPKFPIYGHGIPAFGRQKREHIGNKLAYYKFNTFQNPFGILFHPKAIENIILKAINQEEFTEDAVFYLNERWHSFEAHSELSHANKDTILENLNLAMKETFSALQISPSFILFQPLAVRIQ